MVRPKLLLAASASLLAASPALAGERGFSVTDFERVDVVGPLTVEIVTGKGPSARAFGTPSALDRVSMEVRSRRLVIRPLRNVWGGNTRDAGGPVAIRVTTHAVTDVAVSGTGGITLDRMRGQRVSIFVGGASTLAVGRLDADRAQIVQDGSGSIAIAGGTALSATMSNKGTGLLDASALAVHNLTITSISAGPTRASASVSAKLVALGQGLVHVAGSASCTITAPGGGEIRCGRTAP